AIQRVFKRAKQREVLLGVLRRRRVEQLLNLRRLHALSRKPGPATRARRESAPDFLRAAQPAAAATPAPASPSPPSPLSPGLDSTPQIDFHQRQKASVQFAR